jgi:hypothetical protein
MEAPYTINTIVAQLGTGFYGALCYVGAHGFSYECPPGNEGETRPDRASSITPDGLVDYGVGLAFKVAGPPRAGWRIIVTYEPCDTYSVYMTRPPKKVECAEQGLRGVVLDQASDVYCDNLRHVVQNMFDRALEKHKSRNFRPHAKIQS